MRSNQCVPNQRIAERFQQRQQVASRISGNCLWSQTGNNPVRTVLAYVSTVRAPYVHCAGIVLAIEEVPPAVQNGGSSEGQDSRTGAKGNRCTRRYPNRRRSCMTHWCNGRKKPFGDSCQPLSLPSRKTRGQLCRGLIRKGERAKKRQVFDHF